MDEKDQHLKSFDGQALKDDIKIYQLQVGSLIYAMIKTQPDLVFAILQVSQFSHNLEP